MYEVQGNKFSCRRRKEKVPFRVLGTSKTGREVLKREKENIVRDWKNVFLDTRGCFLGPSEVGREVQDVKNQGNIQHFRRRRERNFGHLLGPTETEREVHNSEEKKKQCFRDRSGAPLERQRGWEHRKRAKVVPVKWHL